MTDNRTTELRGKLMERGIEYTTNDHMGVSETSWNGFTAIQLSPSANLIMAVTPEHAIAATLGSKPDETELTQTYDAGFRNGVMAVFQQLECIEDYEELQDLIAEYWEEGEGNDER